MLAAEAVARFAMQPGTVFTRDMTRLAEGALVRSWGGHALTLPFVDGFSTTSLVDRIRTTARRAPADAP